MPIERRLLLHLALLLGGCASTPPELLALPPAPATAAPIPSSAISVLLRPVAVPGYLDNFPVVIKRDGSRVEIAENTEWAERLTDGVSRVLREALAQRLAPEQLLIAGDGRVPDAELSVELLRMDPQADGRVLLEARWNLVASRGGRTTRAGYARLEAGPAGPEPADIARATSAALGLLADELALQIAQVGF